MKRLFKSKTQHDPTPFPLETHPGGGIGGALYPQGLGSGHPQHGYGAQQQLPQQQPVYPSAPTVNSALPPNSKPIEYHPPKRKLFKNSDGVTPFPRDVRAQESPEPPGEYVNLGRKESNVPELISHGRSSPHSNARTQEDPDRVIANGGGGAKVHRRVSLKSADGGKLFGGWGRDRKEKDKDGKKEREKDKIVTPKGMYTGVTPNMVIAGEYEADYQGYPQDKWLVSISAPCH